MAGAGSEVPNGVGVEQILASFGCCCCCCLVNYVCAQSGGKGVPEAAGEHGISITTLLAQLTRLDMTRAGSYNER